MARTRSPRYPSISLAQAIEKIRELHDVERGNPVDREVAAQAMGYTGMTGSSATVLAGLMQYGLLDKTGKNEVRVSRLAVEILYPDSPTSKAFAIRQAFEKPDLFREIAERFADGHPSENALRSFLIKQDFTHAAIPAAMKAYLDTVLFVENASGNESHGEPRPVAVEDEHLQQVTGAREPMKPQPAQTFVPHQHMATAERRPASVQFVDKSIWLSGVLADQQQADELITVLTALRPMLPQASRLNDSALGDYEEGGD